MRHADLENVPLNDTLLGLKDSLVNSERELRKSLGAPFIGSPEITQEEKENILEKSKKAKEARQSRRKPLQDISNHQRAEPAGNETENPDLPSILSSPLILSKGQPVLKRTPPSKRVKKMIDMSILSDKDKVPNMPAPKKIDWKSKTGKIPVIESQSPVSDGNNKKVNPTKKIMTCNKKKRPTSPKKNGRKAQEKTSGKGKAIEKTEMPVAPSDISFVVRPEDIGSNIWVKR